MSSTTDTVDTGSDTSTTTDPGTSGYESLTFGLNAVEETVVSQLADSETEVTTALSSATGDGELTTGEALQLQYELAKWALLYEASSNVGKKIDDAIGNTVSNMR